MAVVAVGVAVAVVVVVVAEDGWKSPADDSRWTAIGRSAARTVDLTLRPTETIEHTRDQHSGHKYPFRIKIPLAEHPTTDCPLGAVSPSPEPSRGAKGSTRGSIDGQWYGLSRARNPHSATSCQETIQAGESSHQGLQKDRTSTGVCCIVLFIEAWPTLAF